MFACDPIENCVVTNHIELYRITVVVIHCVALKVFDNFKIIVTHIQSLAKNAGNKIGGINGLWMRLSMSISQSQRQMYLSNGTESYLTYGQTLMNVDTNQFWAYILWWVSNHHKLICVSLRWAISLALLWVHCSHFFLWCKRALLKSHTRTCTHLVANTMVEILLWINNHNNGTGAYRLRATINAQPTTLTTC